MDGIGLALGLVLVLLPLLIGAALIIAWIFAIDELIKAAQMKGHHKDSTASLWFVGIFATPNYIRIVHCRTSRSQRARRNKAI